MKGALFRVTQGDTSGLRLGSADFVLVVPLSARFCLGSLTQAELAGQLDNMEGHQNQSQANPVSKQMCHPVFNLAQELHEQ